MFDWYYSVLQIHFITYKVNVIKRCTWILPHLPHVRNAQSSGLKLSCNPEVWGRDTWNPAGEYSNDCLVMTDRDTDAENYKVGSLRRREKKKKKEKKKDKMEQGRYVDAFSSFRQPSASLFHKMTSIDCKLVSLYKKATKWLKARLIFWGNIFFTLCRPDSIVTFTFPLLKPASVNFL